MILNPEHRKEMCYQPKTEDYEKDKSLKELIGNALQLKGWAGVAEKWMQIHIQVRVMSERDVTTQPIRMHLSFIS